MARFQDMQDLLGGEWNKKLQQKVLLVGAGGIGCEALKNLVMSGFTDIVVIDLDTIDLSNLNRQFLFQKKHIKKSKAQVAKESALRFNPNVKIEAHHASIFEDKFDIDWFKSFALVLNALDNIAARRHVNVMCLAANIPLLESGTAGYLGQVSIHKKDLFSCYDCKPKPIEKKTYPVCTIRSTPSEPIHCIVWAKSYLFSHLFGRADEEDIVEEGENQKEVKKLKQEALELKNLRDSLGTPKFAKDVIDKVFTKDIQRLLSMEEMWKSRKKPTPLIFSDLDKASKNFTLKDSNSLEFDQHVWSLEENFLVFKSSMDRLSKSLLEKRKADPEDFFSFDKDDEDALNFVAAAANIRAHIFGIDMKSRFEIKQMAGNIIPAIATTNAIIAGLLVMLAIKVLMGKIENCKETSLVYGSGKIHVLCSDKPQAPNPQCMICSNGYVILEIDGKNTLRDVLNLITSQKGLGLKGEITIQKSTTLLYDIEFEDFLNDSLDKLGVMNSKLSVTNDYDDDESQNHSVVIFVKAGKANSPRFVGSKKFRQRPKSIIEPAAKMQKVDLEDDDLVLIN